MMFWNDFSPTTPLNPKGSCQTKIDKSFQKHLQPYLANNILLLPTKLNPYNNVLIYPTLPGISQVYASTIAPSLCPVNYCLKLHLALDSQRFLDYL